MVVEATQDPPKETRPGPEATPQPSTPEKDPLVFDPETGKPWREIAAEEHRKRVEALERPEQKPEQPPHQPFNREQYKNQFNERYAEDPFEAVTALVADVGGAMFAKERVTVRQQATLRRKTVKKLKETYPDYSEFGHEFEDRLEEMDLSHATGEALELVYQGIRGSHLSKIIDREKESWLKEHGQTQTGQQEPGAVETTPEQRPIGPTASSGSGPVSGGEVRLIPAQENEFQKSNLSSKEVYLKILRHRQENAKKKGCTVMPQTLAEPLTDPTR